MKLLLAIDGSVHSASALEDVIERPWPESTVCKVITIVEPQNKLLDTVMVGGLGNMAVRAQKALEDDMVVALNAALAQLKAKFGDANVSGDCTNGNPKELIIQEAKTMGADMIIIGARGASANPDDTWLSGVARAVTLKAPCTVEVLQPDSTLSIEKKQAQKLDAADSRYLVAVSDEHNAQALVDAILSRPWHPRSEFQIISVIPSVSQLNHQKLLKNKDFQEYAEKMVAAARHEAERIVQAAAEKFKGKFADDKISAHVLEGSPRNLILQVAQDWPADMIFLGSHEEDKNVMEKLFGSTAAAVMWNAPCSVEVVKLSHSLVKK